jgi:hypothetical protein
MAITYEPIATTTLGTAAASVTFSTISGAYTDLVLIIDGKISSGQDDMTLQLNNDTASNYSNTALYGNGSAAGSDNGSNGTHMRIGRIQSGSSTNITNIMNYSNTTTYKTVLDRGNAPDFLTIARVGLWRNTAAITSITIGRANVGDFASGSTFTLYGIASA